jgi:hypothetical protein
MVTKWEGRTWNGREGSIAFTEWTATDRSKFDEKAETITLLDGTKTKPHLKIAKAATLGALKARLAKILA